VPAFTPPRGGSARAVVLLEAAKMFDEDARSGWIDEPGKPLMFWLRRSSEEVAVLMIDTPAVEAAVNRWLEKWAVPGFEPVRVAGGPDQLRTRDGRPLAASGDTTGNRPDLLLPLRSRLGAWELASWDRREIRVRHDTATLAVSGALAVLVALLGVIVFGQQRRAAALAAQRVSFVNRVSHELRSPLTNILLNIDLASEAIDDPAGDATRRLALVQEEARRLGRLIDNVLAFSRHEQGKLHAEPRACVPASVITAVVEQFGPSFARRALTVSCTGGVRAACLLDADALAQILGNLLSNVEKYVPGGEIEITSTLAEGTLTITIADEGPGIPAAAAERIFRPFERLDSRVNEGASGTGLGLAIARDLAASMGGSLRLVPSERGACFELRVPAPPAQQIASVA
jgi:signal transduction histidine kinase